MSDHELLLALSDMMDKKLEPIKHDVTNIEKSLQSVKMELYDEMNRQYKENSKRFDKLESISSTLLLQADNTALLLKLINRQSDELDLLKAKVDEIEKRLA